jgi:hypothetical protein
MHLWSPLPPDGQLCRPNGEAPIRKRSAAPQAFIMNTDQIGVILKRFETPDETRVLEQPYVSLHFLGADPYAK